MRHTPIVPALALAALAVTTLTGCDTYRSAVNYIRADSSSQCPDANILVNTSVIPVFDPKEGADPSNVAYTATISGLSTRCDVAKKKSTIDASVRITFKATRPPGGEAAHYRLPYFVAVTVGGEIIDKQIHWLEFEFPRASATVTVEDLVDSIGIEIARDKRSFDYHLLVGFQLTQNQIDYNKKMGQYLP